MTNKQDARPFVDLQKDAEEFREKFDEDIKECLDFLDAKITALICDPDSVRNTARNVKQNTLVEFSKAKYDIFITIKALMNKKEREWIDYVSEMKKLFIENVEIFLAGTKLEVKLPSSEFEPSPGPRKSPGSRKSTSMTSLGSSLETKETSKIGENVQFNRGSRSSTKLDRPPSSIALFYEKDRDSSESSGSEARADRNEVESTIKGRLSATAFKLTNSIFDDDSMDAEEAEYVEDIPVRKAVRGRKSVKAVTESHISVPSFSKSSLISSDEHVEPEPGTSRSSSRRFFTESNTTDDTVLYTPVTRPVKAAGRRKTLLPNLADIPVSEIIPGNPSRARSKRKTIGGVTELESAAPSKRLKVGSRKNVPSVQVEEDEANYNLLESDDNYSEWMPLKSVDGKVPTNPAIYEVKVWRAKKTAYIGFSESLRQKFTLYKLRQNSGHKHLDKFVDRNYEDIQVRFEIVPSVDFAKQEVKKRITSFTAQHKTTPAYN